MVQIWFIKIFRFPTWFRFSIPFKKRALNLRKRLSRKGLAGATSRNGFPLKSTTTTSTPRKTSSVRHTAEDQHKDATDQAANNKSGDSNPDGSFKIPTTHLDNEDGSSEHVLNDMDDKNNKSGRFRVSAGRSFKFLLDRRSRRWMMIRSKKWSIASTSSMWSFGDDSSATSSAPPAVTSPRETIIIHDEELFGKLESVMSDRRMRDRLVQELLSEHSPAARVVRFLTAINELLATLDRKEWRKKSSKIVSLFVNRNARYQVEIPVEFLPNLIRKRRVGFMDIRRHFLNELTLDSHVTAFLSSQE